MIRIIDHKRIDLTEDEFKLYQQICRSYDRPNFTGEDLFQDHFETNEKGIIIFVKPPYKKYSSLEVFTFLISIMVNQHLRLCHDQVNTLTRESSDKIKKLVKDIDELIEAAKKSKK